MVNYIRKGSLGNSVIRTKTKYEGDHFCAGGLLFLECEDDPNSSLAHEYNVMILMHIL